VLPPHKENPVVPADETKPAAVQDQPRKETVVATGESKYTTDVIPSPVQDDRDLIAKGDKVILIIEDDTSFAKSLLDYTRGQGYKGVVAVRGDEGINLAKQFLPLGILLDVQLPIKSGWEVMEELKSDKTTRPIPVHMMSSYEVMNRSISKGAVDFINKPVAFEKLGEMFQKIEQALSRHPKKVLIVEENTKHAKALAYFLENYNVASEIKTSVGDGISALNRTEVDCVILDMGIPAHHSYDILEEVKKTPGFENLPIIIFTGKNLSHVEEMKIKQYADSIVIKTAHSYQRILDEVSLFLHLVEENKKDEKTPKYKRLGELSEVLRNKTVLVADDDVRNIFSLTKSLENYGMNVISAIDGKDALKQLEESGKVDLVLMDMMMPEMDGYESTRRIRTNPKYRSLPIIAVTAKAMTGDREKCISAGASDYITKPVDVDQLISLLRVWLYE
jgi:CheY-like chemotaxis protein